MHSESPINFESEGMQLDIIPDTPLVLPLPLPPRPLPRPLGEPSATRENVKTGIN